MSFAPDGTSVNGVASQLSSAFAGIPSAAWQQEILRAIQTWAVAANVNVGLVADRGQDFGVPGVPQGDSRFGDIRIAAVPLDGRSIALATPYDVTAGTRAGDVWFNSAAPFSLSGPTANNLYAVALHEAGHVFGIGGSNDPASAMFQHAMPRSGLNAADITAIQALYGARRADLFDAKMSNGSLATASQIQVGSGPGSSAAANVLADITNASDADVYVFQANNLRGRGMTVSVKVNGLSLLVPRVEVLNASGQVVAQAVGQRPGDANVNIYLPQPTTGATYYVRVTGGRTDVFGIGAYRMLVTPDVATTPDNRVELLNPDAGTNDTIANASQLGQQYLSGTGARIVYNVAASLNTSSDVDFYRLKSPQSQNNAPVTMTVTVSASGANGMDPVVEVYNKRAQRVDAQVLVHEAGSFTLQVLGATANEDYYVAVRHAHPGVAAVTGNYNLAVDFRTAPIALTEFSHANLTAATPLMTGTFIANEQQVLHVIFDGSKNLPSMTTVARLTIVDSANDVVDSRLIYAGDVRSLNLSLRPGSYRYIIGAGTTNGTALSGFQFSLFGITLSDPIGPRPIDPNNPSGNPPAPATPGNGPIKLLPPGTIQLPPGPTSPPWWLLPPTDWPRLASTKLGLVASASLTPSRTVTALA
ncbi:MAG: matrixin family metalloprotease [Gemmataceae bacterium]